MRKFSFSIVKNEADSSVKNKGREWDSSWRQGLIFRVTHVGNGKGSKVRGKTNVLACWPLRPHRAHGKYWTCAGRRVKQVKIGGTCHSPASKHTFPIVLPPFTQGLHRALLPVIYFLAPKSMSQALGFCDNSIPLLEQNSFSVLHLCNKLIKNLIA